MAVNKWVPLDSVAVFSEKLNGACVTAAPALALSTRNCTAVALVEAVATTLMVPDTVVPEAGEVTETVTGVFWTLEPLLTVPQPEQSSARTRNVQKRAVGAQ